MRLKKLIVLALGLILPIASMEQVLAAYDMQGCTADNIKVNCNIRLNSYWVGQPEAAGLSFSGIRLLNWNDNSETLAVSKRGYSDGYDPNNTDFWSSSGYFNDYLQKQKFFLANMYLVDVSDNDLDPSTIKNNCQHWLAYAIEAGGGHPALSNLYVCFIKSVNAMISLRNATIKTKGANGRDLYIAFSPYQNDPVITLAVPEASNHPNDNAGWVLGVYNGPGKNNSVSQNYKSKYIKIQLTPGGYNVWLDSNLFQCPIADDPKSCFFGITE